MEVLSNRPIEMDDQRRHTELSRVVDGRHWKRGSTDSPERMAWAMQRMSMSKPWNQDQRMPHEGEGEEGVKGSLRKTRSSAPRHQREREETRRRHQGGRRVKQVVTFMRRSEKCEAGWNRGA